MDSLLMSRAEWRIRKLWRVGRTILTMFRAQMFGVYVHSTSGPDEPDMAVYQYKGDTWAIPTAPLKKKGDDNVV